MKQSKFDVTYVTVDSLSEGVGSSQILPLMQRLSNAGLSVNLISFEKHVPTQQLSLAVQAAGVTWNMRKFEKHGAFGGLSRLLELSREIPETALIHARSDIPAAAASLSRRAPILWDVRSLWADQKAFIEQNPLKKKILKSYGALEHVASFSSLGMSTLTHAIVPILESRYKKVPQLRTVVPTAADLTRFKFSKVIPDVIRGLYSGTYNNYYDLGASQKFIEALQRRAQVEIHWARPKESPQHFLNAGETSTFVATQNEMADIIGSYSFGLSICKMNAGPSLKAAMPTKIAEFLASGRPVAVNAGLGDFDEYLSEFNAGVILDGSPGDYARKSEMLLELIADADTPFRCRELAEKYFDIDKGVENYLALYEKMKL